MKRIPVEGFNTMSAWDQLKIRWDHLKRDQEPVEYYGSGWEFNDKCRRDILLRMRLQLHERSEEEVDRLWKIAIEEADNEDQRRKNHQAHQANAR